MTQLALLGAAVLSSTVTAEFSPTSSDVVTTGDVLRSVLVHHPDVQAAAARLREQRASLVGARGGFDPNLRAVGEIVPEGYYDYRYFDVSVSQATPLWGLEATGGYRLGLPNERPSFAPYNEDLETLEGGEARIEVRVPLLKDGPIDKRRANIRKGRFEVDRAEFDVRSESLRLAREAIVAYWSWRAAVAGVDVAERLRRLAADRDRAVGRRVEEGTLAPVERIEATRALRTREQLVISSRQKAQVAALKLGLFLRDDVGEPAPPSMAAAGQFPTDPKGIDARSLVDGRARALEGRPELASLARKMDALGVQVDLARNTIWPKLDFKGAFSSDFGSTEPPERSVELEPSELKLGLTLAIPLLLREGRGAAQAAEAQREALEQKLRFTRDKLLNEIEQAWVVVLASSDNARVALELSDLAEQVAEAERRRFAEGTADLFTVFLREGVAGEAAAKAIDALATLEAALLIFDLSTCTIDVSDVLPGRTSFC